MKKSLAFTMAEILLSLTIIGVVAAITLPSLMANINERTWNTQRKALYARMSQAIAMMPNLNGYGTYTGTNTDGVVSATEDTAAETFLSEGLSKVLKINNICDNEHLADCGIVSTYTNLTGTTNTWPKKLSDLNPMFTSTYSDQYSNWTNPLNNIDTKAAAFETQNGESIALYYNPSCTSTLALIQATEEKHYTQPKMCANFIYDLNGSKGPNTFGKDIGFITALYPDNPNVVAPIPLTSNANSDQPTDFAGAQAACKIQDPESRLPSSDELAALFFNESLLGMKGANLRGVFWSSTPVNAEKVWRLSFHAGDLQHLNKASSTHVRCIKR